MQYSTSLHCGALPPNLSTVRRKGGREKQQLRAESPLSLVLSLSETEGDYFATALMPQAYPNINSDRLKPTLDTLATPAQSPISSASYFLQH